MAPALMMAGPAELHEETLAVLGRQVVACAGPAWVEQHARVLELLRRLVGGSEAPYLLPGTGTTSLDAAMLNLFEPGARVVVANTGFFGQRLAEAARAQRLEVIEVPVEVGAPIDPDAIARAARDGIAGIITVHVETSTGVRHPVELIAPIARANDAIYMVDGIASVGGEHVDIAAMGIDCLVTSAQKGLESPPGLGVIALGERGRAAVRARTQRPGSWALDLETWDWYRREWAASHPHPVTMPTSLVLAMLASLERITARGLDTVIRERAELAARCRAGLIKLGYELVPQPGVESNMIVAIHADDAPAIARYLLSHEIAVSGGLPPLQGRAIRIGLMGRCATTEMVDRVLSVLAERSPAARSSPASPARQWSA